MKKILQWCGILPVLLAVMSWLVLAGCRGDGPVDDEDILGGEEDISKYVITDDPSTWRGLSKMNFYAKVENPGYDDCGNPVRESDIALMRKMGFNCLRVPMDYHWFYDRSANGGSGTNSPAGGAIIYDFDNQKGDGPTNYVARMDELFEYAKKYKVHLNLALTVAPGYAIASSMSEANLFTGTQSGLPHFIKFWEFFAERYKEYPNSLFSINLINEPEPSDFLSSTTGEMVPLYKKAIEDTINAIRKITPTRLIVLDNNCRNPLNLEALNLDSYDELASPTDNIILSPHCYFPWSVTHDGFGNQFGSGFPADQRQVTWPIQNYFNGYIYGPGKSKQFFGLDNTRAVFNHPTGFAAGTVTVTTARVSGNNNLRLVCDGTNISTTVLAPSSGSVSFPANSVPAGTKKIEILIPTGGDWVVISRFDLPGNITVKTTNADWLYNASELTVGQGDIWSDAQLVRTAMFPPGAGWFKTDAEGKDTTEFKYPVMIGEMSSYTKVAEGAKWRAKLMGAYVDAFKDICYIFWEFKGGAMCIFNLDRSVVWTHPVEVTWDDGQKKQKMTYYYDKRWYDEIKHTLDLPANKK